MKRCLELSVASDWISEQEMDYTAIQLEKDTPNPKGCEDIPLREFFFRHQNDAVEGFQNIGSLSARAKGILNCHTLKRFCSICGGQLHDDEKFTARTCSKCGHQFFPQLEPAIIVLVTKGDEYLLAKHANRNTDQLMLAFRAEYESGKIKAQEGEILEAKWFHKDSLPNVPPPGSVAHNLISGVFG